MSAARWTKPAQTPTMSAIASRAPTSWKCTSSGVVPWTAASATARRSRPPGRGADRRVEGRRLEQRPDVGPGAVVLGVGDARRGTWSRRGRRAGPSRCAAPPAPVRTAPTASCSTSSGHTGAEQRAEQHVAAGARRGVDPADRAVTGGALCRATRAACTPAPNPLSMLTTVTPGAQELSIASRAASPPSARRSRRWWAPRRAARRRARRPRDGSAPSMPATTIRQSDGGQAVADVEQPVQPGDPDVVDAVDRSTVHRDREGGLGRDRRVRGAGAHHADGAAGRRQRTDGHRPGDLVEARVRQHGPDHVERLRGEPGGEDGPLRVPLVEGAQDRHDLVGGLPGAVHRLGVTGPGRAVEVDPREAEVFGPLVHAPNLAPERVSGINAQDLHLGGEERQLLEGVPAARRPRDGRRPRRGTGSPRSARRPCSSRAWSC